MSALASQAAVAIENSILYEDIEKLFDGFVSASVQDLLFGTSVIYDWRLGRQPYPLSARLLGQLCEDRGSICARSASAWVPAVRVRWRCCCQ